MLRIVDQRVGDRGDQGLKFRKVAIMRRAPFQVFPEELNRVVIRRVRRQLKDRQAGLLSHELLQVFAGVILGPVVNQDNRLVGLGQDGQQIRLIRGRRKALATAVIKESSREILDRSEDFVALAFTGRFDDGLLTDRRPRVAQRAPLRETGFIFKQQQRPGAAGLRQNFRPRLLHPDLSRFFIQVIRHKARFLKREAQVPQQLADVLFIIQHAKLALDQILDQQPTPTARRITCLLRSGGDQLAQAGLLRLRQLGRTAWRGAIRQTRIALQQKGAQPAIHTGFRDTQSAGNRLDRNVLRKLQQRGDASDQPRIAPAIRFLQAPGERLDGSVPKVYAQIQGMPLGG